MRERSSIGSYRHFPILAECWMTAQGLTPPLVCSLSHSSIPPHPSTLLSLLGAPHNHAFGGTTQTPRAYGKKKVNKPLCVSFLMELSPNCLQAFTYLVSEVINNRANHVR